MKIYAILGCAVLATSLVTAVAFAVPATTTSAAPAPKTAQGPPRPKQGVQQFPFCIIPVTIMSTVTSLTDAQKTKIQAIDTKFLADLDAAQMAPPDPSARQKVRTLVSQADTDVRAALTANQITAMDGYIPAVQLLTSIVKGGPGAFARINVTLEQLNKFKAIEDDLVTKQMALDQQRQALVSAAIAQASDVFTADQKAALDAKPATAIPQRTALPVAPAAK